MTGCRTQKPILSNKKAPSLLLFNLSSKPKSCRFYFSVLFIAGLFTAAGCENKKEPAVLLNEAQTSVESGDIKSAIVQLKAILQTNPDHLPTRIQLGRLYQTTGNLAGAKKELEYALRNNGNHEEIIPPLLSVYLSLGDTSEALTVPLDNLSDDSLAVAYSFQAEAARSEGDIESSKNLIEKANQISSESPEVKTTTAALSISDNPQEAESMLQSVVEKNPEYAPAWRQLASIYRTGKDLESAEKAYDEAIKLNPTNAADYLRRASLRIENGDFDAAQKDLYKAKELASGYYEIDFLQGVIHMARNKHMEAQTSLRQVYNKQPQFAPNIYYLALNSFFIEQYDTAQSLATVYYELNPDYLPSRLLLAQTHLKQGHYLEARRLLEEVANAHPENRQLLSSLADAYHGLQQYNEELAPLSKLRTLLPDNQFIQLRQAEALFRSNASEKGLKAANDILVKYPDNWRSAQLIIAYYSTKESYSEAVDIAQEFVNNNPDNPNAYNLLGLTQLQLNQPDAAEKSLLKAKGLAPTSISVLHNLAKLSILNEDPEEAKLYYRQALEIDDKNLSTLVQLALLEQKDNEEDFIKLLETAISYHPNSLQPRYLLARFYLNQGLPDKILTTLGESKPRETESRALAMLLAEYHLNYGDLADAKQNINQILKSSPTDVDGIFLNSQLLAKQGNDNASRQEIDKALDLEPTHLLSNLANIENLLASRKYETAKKQSQKLLATYPDNPSFLLTEGKAFQGLGDLDEAEKSLNQAYTNAPSTQTIIPYATVLYQKTPSKGYQLMEDWLKKQPDDIASRNILAGIYLKDGLSDKAARHYEKVLTISNDNLMALNNLAWEYRKKDPKKALDYAQKATYINSKSPDLMDTLAVVLMHNNQNEKALRIINKVTEEMDISKDDPSFFYHKAQILKALGKTQESRTILSAVVDSGSSFTEREEAQTLLEKL